MNLKQELERYNRVALVLSGGGANGAFQVGAEMYCRRRLGIQWSCVAGQSVGALNAAMIAMGRYKELDELWQHIRRGDVYTVKPSLWRVLWALFTKKLGLSSNEPLGDLLEELLKDPDVKIPLRYGAVDLITGKYVQFTEKDLSPETLRASANIPIVWPPLESFVDGGLVNNGPISDVLSLNPDLIVIINCKPRISYEEKPMPRGIVPLAGRLLDIVLDESFRNDYETFLHINDIVTQIENNNDWIPEYEKTFMPRHSSGRPYKAFDYIFIEPGEAQGSALDFNPDKIKYLKDYGYKQAAEAFLRWRPRV